MKLNQHIGYFILLLSTLLLSGFVYGQNTTEGNYAQLVSDISVHIEGGEKRALRDLATLIEKTEIRDDILDVLQRHTLFTSREISISRYTSKQQLLDFYYENEDKIQFSELLQVFYITPLDERAVYYTIESSTKDQQTDVAIRLRQHVRRFEQYSESGDYTSAATQIQRIAQLDLPEGYQYLLNIMRKRPYKRKSKAARLYRDLCQALTTYYEPEVIDAMVLMANKRMLPFEYVKEQLSILTNVKVKDTDRPSKYRHYLDSLGSVEKMRTYGYDRYFNFKSYYFSEPADYYGKILSLSDTLDWVQRNAIKDLSRTKHPRALYYLAAQIFHIVNDNISTRVQPHALHLELRSLIAADVQVHDNRKEFVQEPSWGYDTRGLLNYMIYWASHYEDYEWDTNRRQFINKTVSQTLSKRYKLHFRRLTSTNDSVARISYLELTEGDPEDIIQLAYDYKPVLDGHNSTLPPIRYNYLERLVELTDYCRSNNLFYKPSGRLKVLLQELKNSSDARERYRIEKQILATINTSELTAVEYWGLLNVADEHSAFSAAWILDKAYTQHWNEIIKSNKFLRLYLKKSYLFGNLGVDGIGNDYLSKFDANSTELRVQLERLLRLETDNDITRQAGRLLVQLDVAKPFIWQDLLTKDFDLELLPPPKYFEYPEIVDAIIESDDERTKRQLVLYLSLHPEIAQVPHLMYLLQRHQAESDAVTLLENIYTYRFQDRNANPREEWLLFWKADSTRYRYWGLEFSQNMITNLRLSKELSIDDINAVTNSAFYEDSYRDLCLKSLEKVKPTRSIRRLEIEPQMSVARDLRYLEKIDFSYRELADLSKLLIVDDTDRLLFFFQRKINGKKVRERGSFYNNLFRLKWFDEYLRSDKYDRRAIIRIRSTLEEYLTSGARMSKFERQASILNMAKIDNLKQLLETKLTNSFTLDVDDSAKAEMQKSIIAEASYSDIPVIIRYYEQLSPLLDYNFLHDDFGLPIFNLEDRDRRKAIINLHGTSDRKFFYTQFLKAFGIDFETNGKLDHQKIYDILRYDIVRPLAGDKNLRDYYVYGVIKLLELEFSTRLGFHEKLNENQTLYQYDTRERAKAWLDYLLRRKLAKPLEGEVPAFMG